MVYALYFLIGFVVGVLVLQLANRRAMRDYLHALYTQLKVYHLPGSNWVVIPFGVFQNLFDGVSNGAQKN